MAIIYTGSKHASVLVLTLSTAAITPAQGTSPRHLPKPGISLLPTGCFLLEPLALGNLVWELVSVIS